MLTTRILPVFAAFAFAKAAPYYNVTDTTDYSNLTVALVRAAPPGFPSPILSRNYTGLTFDLNGTVEYGIKLIEEAATNGANLVVFPELWFPGYVALFYLINISNREQLPQRS
jgi:nitrilase